MQLIKKPIGVVVMGPSGVGKTTIAQLLVNKTHWRFAEADEFHPQANKDKMAAGIPLNDEDRKPWLERLKNLIDKNAQNSENTIITCSALKRIYRDILRQTQHANIFFAELYGPETLVAERISNRQHDYMPASLLDSQYAILESLQIDEFGARFSISIAPDEISNEILTALDYHATNGEY
ncbi:gluconokinase [Bartonella sp. HY329]|uniref:gluconokinase n=1 Tax=unclassified Bartonella TaxID=2645622 RepID=UPI0021C88A0F|nr:MULTISPECIES: gluconokinase [unclassified Bartonella]UXM93981.1 gluconokinase [Bartonella sp. HY329]UXN08302.1 gluconokinase [Bartonella sp. HY328]